MADEEGELILLSRQALLFADSDTLNVLQSSSALIFSASTATAFEIARNLGLAGLNRVYMLNNESSHKDTENYFKSQFFNETIIQKIEFLPSLNDNNDIHKHDEFQQLIEKIKPNIVVVCDAHITYEKYRAWNLISRSKNIPYIQTLTCGLMSYVFVDVGDHFTFSTISDQRIKKVIRSFTFDIEHPHRVIIEVADKRHQLTPGIHVKFSLLGDDNDNDDKFRNYSKYFEENGPFEVSEFISANQFAIKVNSNHLFDRDFIIASSGSVEEVERSHDVHHKSLEENINTPVWHSPYISARAVNQMFVKTFFTSISEYTKLHSGNLPRIRNHDDYNHFVSLFADQFSSFANNDLLKTAVFQSQGVVPAMVNIIGGIISQEVLKILHRSFQPITQWLYFESLSCLPHDYLTLPDQNFIPFASEERFKDHIRIFGREIQHKLSKKNLLIVGAGALGCEFLKVFSAMGVASNYQSEEKEFQAGGTIYLCDADHISASNLHRQFLFQKADIGKSKAKTASQRMKNINAEMNITPYESQLSFHTILNTFTDHNIWNNINEVICAVDTAVARVTIDRLCSSYKKIMVESGTRGNICNTNLIIPCCTSRYTAIPDPNAETNCLGKAYPFRPRHTVAWAKDLFKLYFRRSVLIYNNAPRDNFTLGLKLEDEEDREAERFLRFLRRIELSILEKCDESVIDVILDSVVSELYDSLFDRIKRMQENNPLDSLDEHGEKFWSGYKIYPRLLDESGDESIRELKSVFFSSCRSLIQQIVSSVVKTKEVCPLRPLKFNKDNELHINFLYATGNLYSKCFGIPMISKIEVQTLGGDITPAIITISCICVGLVALELYKIIDYVSPSNTSNVVSIFDNNSEMSNSITDNHHHHHKIIDALKNHSYNANLNHFHQFPIDLIEFYNNDHNQTIHHHQMIGNNDESSIDGPISVMDNIIIVKTDNRSLTFSSLVEKIKEKLGIRILRIFSSQFHHSGSGYAILYAEYRNSDDDGEVEKSIHSLLSSLGKFSTSSFFFTAEFEDYDGENSIDLFLQFHLK